MQVFAVRLVVGLRDFFNGGENRLQRQKPEAFVLYLALIFGGLEAREGDADAQRLTFLLGFADG